jgi:hypothetical protein
VQNIKAAPLMRVSTIFDYMQDRGSNKNINRYHSESKVLAGPYSENKVSNIIGASSQSIVTELKPSPSMIELMKNNLVYKAENNDTL